MNTKSLSNKKVWSQKPTKKDAERVKKAGRIHAFVFHPNRPELVGFLIKRPDIAWMFRREDMFVAYDGFVIIDGDIIVKEDPEASGKGALKALAKRESERQQEGARKKKVTLDDCVIWFGLPVITQSGQTIGIAESVEFDEETGKVISLELSQGATANAVLGRRSIPAHLLKGFRRGIGASLSDPADVQIAEEQADEQVDEQGHSAEQAGSPQLGAIVVDDAAADVAITGGAAEKAGQASAIAADKARRTYRKIVKKAAPKAAEDNAGLAEVAKEAAGNAASAAKKAGDKVYSTVDKASDATSRAVDKAGDMAEKGAYAAGKQVARAAGMFSGFASAFKDALNDDQNDDDKV